MSLPGVFTAGSKGPGASTQLVNPELKAFHTFRTVCSLAACTHVPPPLTYFPHVVVYVVPISLMYFGPIWCVCYWIKGSTCLHSESESRVHGTWHVQDLLFPCGLHPGSVSSPLFVIITVLCHHLLPLEKVPR